VALGATGEAACVGVPLSVPRRLPAVGSPDEAPLVSIDPGAVVPSVMATVGARTAVPAWMAVGRMISLGGTTPGSPAHVVSVDGRRGGRGGGTLADEASTVVGAPFVSVEAAGPPVGEEAARKRRGGRGGGSKGASVASRGLAGERE